MNKKNLLLAASNLAGFGEEMRHWQRQYFTAKSGTPEKATALTRAKAAEKKFDEALVAYRKLQAFGD